MTTDRITHKIEQVISEWNEHEQEYVDVIVHAEDCPACLADPDGPPDEGGQQ